VGRRLGVRCERLNPAAALGLEEGGPEASAFISALGLAHGQTGEIRVPFDFLNPKRPVVRRDMRKILAAAVAAGLGIVLAAIVTGAALHRYSASARADVLRDQYKELTDENRKISALAKRAETVDSWVRSGRGWLEQWAYLSAVFPSCAEVYVTNLKTNPDGSVSFNVRAKSNEAINDLGKRLSAAGYDFKPGQVTTGTDPHGYGYGTTIKVMVKPSMKIDLASAAPVPRPEDDTSATQFGKPAPTAAAPVAAGATAASNSQGMPGPDAPYSVRLKAWTNRYEAINRERPPESSPDYQEWRARREALRAEYPKPPMSGSSTGPKHR
jgi:hypothetical protein